MKRIIFITLLTISTLVLSAQSAADSTERNNLDNLILRSVAIETLFPEERVYLHFD